MNKLQVTSSLRGRKAALFVELSALQDQTKSNNFKHAEAKSVLRMLDTVERDFRELLKEIHSHNASCGEAKYKINLSDSTLFNTVQLSVSTACFAQIDAVPDSGSNSSVPKENGQLSLFQIEPFDGSINKYPTFIAQYNQLIHNSSLSDIEKLTYLRSLTKSDVGDLVSRFEVTSANYKLAYDSLVAKYSENRRLAKFHFKQLLREISGKDINTFLELSRSSLSGLLSLGVLDLADYLIFELILNNCPEDWRKSYESEHKETFPTASHLLEHLAKLASRKELKIPQDIKLENCVASPSHSLVSDISSCEYEPYESENNAAPLPLPKCFQCGEQHEIYDCSQFSNLSHSQRLASVKSHKLCVNCLGEHFVEGCTALKICNVCQGKHHSYLHNAFSEIPVSKRNEGQLLYDDPEFLQMSHHERLALIKSKKLCVNCLGSHSLEDCTSTKMCSHCSKKHHSYLHNAFSGSSLSGCPQCQQRHSLYACRLFMKIGPNEKLAAIKAWGHCVNCLGSHSSQECHSNHSCKHCNKKHHSFLHDAFDNAPLPMQTRSCYNCKGDHLIYVCSKFLNLTPHDRLSVARDSHCCVICLDHSSNLKCLSNKVCEDCGGRHHSTLHLAFIQGEVPRCFHCNGDHSINACSEFLSLPHRHRLASVTAKKHCVNCLRNHSLQECDSSDRCSKCGGRHHSFLHKAFIEAVCFQCNGNHKIKACPEFSNLSHNDRLDSVKAFKHCVNCLRKHSLQECPSKNRCNDCGGHHHSFLHEAFNEAEAVPSKCFQCNGNHPIYVCPAFLNLSHHGRLDSVKASKHCVNCLSDHLVEDCESMDICRECGDPHHSFLHKAFIDGDATRPRCFQCNGIHPIYICSVFSKMSHQDRLASVKAMKHCVKCLGDHSLEICDSTVLCKDCGGQHHSCLHKAFSKEVSAVSSCFQCSGEHQISVCPEFLNMSHCDRLDLVQEVKYCVKCLSDHLVENCKSTEVCAECAGQHHSCLHKAFVEKVTEAPRCFYCQGNHQIYICAEFLSKSPSDRLASVKAVKHCTNCMADHLQQDCDSTGVCSECGDHHHSLLHQAFFEGEAIRPNCFQCNGDHPIYICSQFSKLSHEERLAAVQAVKHCVKCLADHSIQECDSSDLCRECGGEHHTCLHKAFIKEAPKCFKCNGDHPIYTCSQFSKLSPEERLVFVKAVKHCVKCLGDHLLEMCDSTELCRDCGGQHHPFLHKAFIKEAPRCFKCYGNHHIFSCSQFAKLSHEERLAFVEAVKYCVNCLANHSLEDCGSSARCKECGLKHNSRLHKAFLQKQSSLQPTCFYCKGQHFVTKCSQFLRLSHHDKLAWILSKKHCVNCLKSHSQQACKSSYVCKECGDRHHSQLHGAFILNEKNGGRNSECFHCNGNHDIYDCAKFLNLSHYDRVVSVRAKNHCVNCLEDHTLKDCGSTKFCEECDGRHHKFFHRAFVQEEATRPGCFHCNGNHDIYDCAKFLNLSHYDRLASVRAKNHCVNCLEDHALEDCCSTEFCEECDGRHHRFLHKAFIQEKAERPGCFHCNGNHDIYDCAKFLNLSHYDRLASVRAKNHCVNCLEDHSLKDCGSTVLCIECDGHHHRFLHKAFIRGGSSSRPLRRTRNSSDSRSPVPRKQARFSNSRHY